MVGQVTEQSLLQTAAPAGKTRKQDQTNGTGFDELLQQKQQAGSETAARTQDGRPAERKDEAPKAEAREDAAAKAESGETEELPDDVKAALAAMMLQPQPEIVEVQMDAEAPAEIAAAAVQTVEDAPVQELAAQTQEQPQQAAMAPVQREQTVETAQAQPQQEVQQAEVVTAAPETTETQPRQTGEGGGQQTAVETVKTERAPEKAEDEEPVEAPLFQQEVTEEAVPVKVADPAPVLNQERPLPIESAEAPEDLANVIVTGVENGSEVSIIRITPENLGPVQLTLTREADGVLHVALEAANPKTAALLEKHAGNVQNIMAGNLSEEVRVEVKEHDRPQQQDLTDGQNRQSQQQERQQRQQKEDSGDHDFLQRLRLGLIGPEDDD